MKRKALLIGNTSGLQGVSLDLRRFDGFLKSERGGAWNQSEITLLENPGKKTLYGVLERVKRDKPDYLVVMFSGHGGHARSTKLELNQDGEEIYDRELENIAARQLNIYDCCRAVLQPAVESFKAEAYAVATFDSISRVRELYDARILQAVEQQAILYACSIGEYARDTAQGALYLKELLKSPDAMRADQRFLTIGIAHETARRVVETVRSDQHPDSCLVKCLTSQQLIFAISP